MADFYIEPPPTPGADKAATPKFTIEPPVGSAAPAAAAAPTVEPPAAAPFEPVGEMPIDAAGRQMGRTLVPPVVNFLTTPFRAPFATAYGVGSEGGALPVDEESRKKFYAAKQKAMEATALPETEGGQSISNVLSLPGQGLSSLARTIGNYTIGPQTTDAVAPYVSSAAEVALPAAGMARSRQRGAVPQPQAHPHAVDARAAGYVLPPEEIGGAPSLTARLMSGESGKWKKQQDFSDRNQRNTNNLAARSIGLPNGTRLTEPALDRARQPAVQGYDAIRTAVPDTALAADPLHRQAVDNIGVRTAETQDYFPDMARHPAILALRDELLHSGTAPTATVMRKIADLRKQASSNYRVPNNAEAHALGHAQRQAATALEEAIERSIGYGPPRMQAMAARAAAEAEVARQTALNTTRGYGPGGLPQAQAALQAADQALQALPPVTAAEAANATALRTRYQQARQLFARVYDVELALNLGTRDVVAHRVANLRRSRGRPLEGELEQIANASEAFPREMQDPARFGGREDFSLFDVIGGAAAAAAGHPVTAGIIAGRYPTRRLMGSEWMQNRMFNRPPPSTSGGYLAGAAAAPSGVQEDDPLARALGQ